MACWHLINWVKNIIKISTHQNIALTATWTDIRNTVLESFSPSHGLYSSITRVRWGRDLWEGAVPGTRFRVVCSSIILILLEPFACDLLSMNLCYAFINPFSFTAICVALVVYDYSLTLSREVDLIWFSRWNVIKVTFLLQRYLPFLDVILFSISSACPRILHIPVSEFFGGSVYTSYLSQFLCNSERSSIWSADPYLQCKLH